MNSQWIFVIVIIVIYSSAFTIKLKPTTHIIKTHTSISIQSQPPQQPQHNPIPDDLLHKLVPLKPRSPPYKITACAIYRNEQHNVAQWIIYHYLLGIEHFYLLDNESDDKSAAVLKPFIDMNLVTHINWPGDFHKMLWQQFQHCSNATIFAPITEWMGLFEVDEYLVLPGWDLSDTVLQSLQTVDQRNFPLHRFLNDYKASRCGGVWVDRMNFDSNGHEQRPNGLVMSEFTSRELSMRQPKTFGKNIVHFDGLDRLTGGHSFIAKEGWHACFADHTRLEVAFDNITHHVYEPMRLHHYLALSYKECMGKVEVLKKRNSDIVDWRIIQGQQFCDKHMVGTDKYVKEEHVQDRTLADSRYPVVVHQLLEYTMKDVKI